MKRVWNFLRVGWAGLAATILVIALASIEASMGKWFAAAFDAITACVLLVAFGWLREAEQASQWDPDSASLKDFLKRHQDACPICKGGDDES